jgi:hypothetical protein
MFRSHALTAMGPDGEKADVLVNGRQPRELVKSLNGPAQGNVFLRKKNIKQRVKMKK